MTFWHDICDNKGKRMTMAQKDKQLLMKDLCGRLPYGVMCRLSVKDVDISITEKLDTGGLEHFIYGTMDVLPYLRAMASMTEEETKEYRNLSDEVVGSYGPYHREFIVHCVRLGIKPDNPHECVDDFLNMEAIDWLNEHHFDYRGLIEKGLALEAPEGMYK